MPYSRTDDYIDFTEIENKIKEIDDDYFTGDIQLEDEEFDGFDV